VAIGTSREGVEGHFLVDPTSGRTRPLISFRDLDATTEGVWSSDGETFFNRFSDARRGVFRFDMRTRKRTVLYVPPPGVDLGLENLVLSPDGKTLAFHARNDNDGTAALLLLPVAGGAARPLMTIRRPEVFLFGAFSWTPDSKQLLVAKSKNRLAELWRVPVNGNAPVKMELAPVPIRGIRLNADGRTVAFTKVDQRDEIWALENFLN
jgi:dipeptidyl aminopeptidase/acylaminoacyl peptidase